MKNFLIFLIIVILALLAVWYYSQNSQGELEEEIMLQEEAPSEEAITEGGSEDQIIEREEQFAVNEEINEFYLTASNFKYDLKEIRVKEGDKVRINLSVAEGLHDWMVGEFNAATSQIQAGQSDSVEFVANRKGEFEYYCSVNSHRAMGMVGKLIVE